MAVTVTIPPTATPTGKTYPPGHIAALVWVAALSSNQTVFDLPEDDEFTIGCRVTAGVSAV